MSTQDTSMDDEADIDTAPTIVMGVGKAGCGMARALYDIVDRQGLTRNFFFIPIDSNHGDLNSIFDPTDAWEDEDSDIDVDTINRVKLNPSTQFYDTSVENSHFLRDGYVPGKSELMDAGVKRDRAIGRYYFDNIENTTKMRNTLKEILDSVLDNFSDFLKADDTNQMNIWLMHSLGGGTGSGTFPYILHDLHYILHESGFLGSHTGIDRGDIGVRGIASHPVIRSDIKSQHGMDMNNHTLNTYAGLRDLMAITESSYKKGRDETKEFESDGIYVQGVPETSREVTYQLKPGRNEDLVDRYFLLPHEPGEPKRDSEFREQLNRSAAVLPLWWSICGSENLDVDWFNKKILSYDYFEVKSPLEVIDEFFDLREEINELELEIENHKERIRKLDQDIDFLGRVLAVDILNKEFDLEEFIGKVRVGEEDEEGDLVTIFEELDSEKFIDRNRIENLATAASSYRIGEMDEVIVDPTEEAEDVEEELEEVMEDREDKPPYNVEKTYESMWFYNFLTQSITETVEDHSFRDVVDEKFEKYRDRFDEFEEQLSAYKNAADTTTKYTGLKIYLDRKIDELTEKKEEAFSPGAALAIVVISGFLGVGGFAAMSTFFPGVGGESGPLLAGVGTIVGSGILLTMLAPQIRPLKLLILSRKLGKLEGDRNELRDEFEEYKQAKDDKEEAKNRHEEKRSSLETRESELESELEQEKRDKQNTERELGNAIEKKANVRERLDETKIMGERSVDLPVSDTDTITDELKIVSKEYKDGKYLGGELEYTTEEGETETTNDYSLSELIDIGIIDENRFEDEVKEVIGLTESGTDGILARGLIEDTGVTGDPTDKFITYLSNKKNEGIASPDCSWADRLEDADADLPDQFVIWYLAMEEPNLLNTSEFERIDEIYREQGDAAVAETLGVNVEYPEHCVTRLLAYPEFHADDEDIGDRVREFFPMGTMKEEPKEISD